MTKDEILFAIQEVVAHAGGEWPDTAGEPEVLRRVKMLARMAASHGQAPAQPDQPIACSYGDNGYACCEGGPCQADVHNDKLAEQQAPATAQAAESVLEDAARLDFLIEQRAYVVSDPDACPGHWLHWAMPDGRTWVQGDEHPTPRAAIDAARKQGARWQSAVRALTLHI